MITISGIKAKCAEAGNKFFDDDRLAFFDSVITDQLFGGIGGIYFVTSEVLTTRDGRQTPRKFTIRQFLSFPCPKIITVGLFHDISDVHFANLAAERLATTSLQQQYRHCHRQISWLMDIEKSHAQKIADVLRQKAVKLRDKTIPLVQKSPTLYWVDISMELVAEDTEYIQKEICRVLYTRQAKDGLKHK